MAITMPKIEISFEQRAVSLIGRSERGIAILIVRDDTDKSFTHKQYSDLSAAQADESLYTADNYNAICDLLGFAPYQMHLFRLDTPGALADTLTEISKTVKTGWLTSAGQSADDGLALAARIGLCQLGNQQGGQRGQERRREQEDGHDHALDNAVLRERCIRPRAVPL